jgi:hypothetical protein
MKTLVEYIESLLLESLQKVYHATYLDNAISILKNDEIELNPNIAKVEKQMGPDKYYFLSTMRNKSGKYFLGSEGHSKRPRVPLYFELDFDSLKSKMKSKSVDYWGSGRKGSEEEERFWSNEPKLDHVNKFINSIHVLVENIEDADKNKTNLVRLKDLELLAKTRKISIYFYDNPENYVLGKRPIDFQFPEDISPSSNYYTKKSEYHEEVIEIVKFLNGERLAGHEVKHLKGKLFGYFWEENIGVIEHYLHASGKNIKEEQKKYSREFVELMRKYKKKDVKSFLIDIVRPELKKKLGSVW